MPGPQEVLRNANHHERDSPCSGTHEPGPQPRPGPGPAHVLDFCHGAPRAMGPGASWGEGAGKQSKLDWGPLDGPRLTRPPVPRCRTPSSLSSSPPSCCGAFRPCSPPSSTTQPSSKRTGRGETPHTPHALALLGIWPSPAGQPFPLWPPCPGQSQRCQGTEAGQHPHAGRPPSQRSFLG